MANGTLEGLLREPKNRLTDRAAFIQAISRLSCMTAKKVEPEPKPTNEDRKSA